MSGTEPLGIPPLNVGPTVPPTHSPNSGLEPGQVQQADSAAALATVVPIEGEIEERREAVEGGPPAPPQAPRPPLPAPEDISPEADYHGRGPAVVGIAHTPDHPAPAAASAPIDHIGEPDLGFEAGHSAPLAVPVHEPLEPEDRLDPDDVHLHDAQPGVLTRLRRALFG